RRPDTSGVLVRRPRGAQRPPPVQGHGRRRTRPHRRRDRAAHRAARPRPRGRHRPPGTGSALVTANWLVIAAVCDCPGVAVTVMDNWQPGTEAPGPGEMTATGPDWRTLVPYLARDLARETG